MLEQMGHFSSSGTIRSFFGDAAAICEHPLHSCLTPCQYPNSTAATVHTHAPQYTPADLLAYRILLIWGATVPSPSQTHFARISRHPVDLRHDELAGGGAHRERIVLRRLHQLIARNARCALRIQLRTRVLSRYLHHLCSHVASNTDIEPLLPRFTYSLSFLLHPKLTC